MSFNSRRSFLLNPDLIFRSSLSVSSGGSPGSSSGKRGAITGRGGGSLTTGTGFFWVLIEVLCRAPLSLVVADAAGAVVFFLTTAALLERCWVLDFLEVSFLDAGFLDAGFLDAGFLEVSFLDTGFLDAGFLDAGFLVAVDPLALLFVVRGFVVVFFDGLLVVDREAVRREVFFFTVATTWLRQGPFGVRFGQADSGSGAL